MLVFVVYVPLTHAEVLKEAMFSAGAGAIGDYTHCAWQVTGQGQFKPSDAAQPFIGEANVVTKVAECRIEMVCDEQFLENVINALRVAHPYEEPAFHVLNSVV